MKKIILASGSPRRKELVALLPWSFEIITKEVDECLQDDLSMEENVQALALKKALAVGVAYNEQWVVGADTMVCLDGKLLGKPSDERQAYYMLSQLSGKVHQVLTGVAIVCEAKGIRKTFVETTDVKMQKLSDEEIMDYIATKEPMDKAGSYAVQGLGSKFIERIEGDYFNVVGLPIHRLYEMLNKEIK